MKPMDTYDVLRDAFKFFNKELFNNSLADCLIILHRHRNAYGYFCADRMAETASDSSGKKAPVKVHEIALNPQHIRGRKARDTFSTLVHEMVHQLQQEHGKPPKGAYHNKQWAAMMKDVGLHPSDTAAPGGAETGRYVSHYIVKGGRYDIAFEKFVKSRDLTLFGDLPFTAAAKAKTSKHKFECPECRQCCWGKETGKFICGECNEEMELAD
jgi:hypothetical protein